MNQLNLTYCPIALNATLSGTFVGSSFTGKERDDETGYSYFGARYYDADLLTGWVSVDPMADKYPSISPYNYCVGNPIRIIDFQGFDTINFADSRFLRTQPDFSNILIINAHGISNPPQIENNNVAFLDDFEIKTGENRISVYEFAEFLKNTAVYQNNTEKGYVTPIFLISCQTGEISIPYFSFAQSLEDKIKSSLIIAPIGNVHTINGTMHLEPKEGNSLWYKSFINECYWSILYDGQEIGRINNSQALDVSTLIESTQNIVNWFNTNNPENQILLPEIIQQ